MKRERIDVNLEVKATFTCPLCKEYITTDTDEMVNHMVKMHGENADDVFEELVDEVYGQFQLVGSDFWLGR